LGRARKEEVRPLLVLLPAQDKAAPRAVPLLPVPDAETAARARAEVGDAVRVTVSSTPAAGAVLAGAGPVKQEGDVSTSEPLLREKAVAIEATTAAPESERAGVCAEEGASTPDAQLRAKAAVAIGATAAASESRRAGAEAEEGVTAPDAQLRVEAVAAIDAAAATSELGIVGAEAPVQKSDAPLGTMAADGAASQSASTRAERAAAQAAEASTGLEAAPRADAAAEAAAALVRRVAKADPSTPLSEIADAWAERADHTSEAGHDREAAAAQAAGILLRRLAKVGPGAPIEDVAKAWSGLPSPQVQGRRLRACKSSRSSPELTASSPDGLTESSKTRRRVRFNPAACSVHEIVPYGEIYGLHPREFVFDRHSRMVPADRRWGCAGLSAADSESTEAGATVQMEETAVADEEGTVADAPTCGKSA